MSDGISAANRHCRELTDKDFEDARSELSRKWEIGATVVDEDGNFGVVVIRWDDGDTCAIENDAAHPNPKIIVDGVVDGEDIEKIIVDSA